MQETKKIIQPNHISTAKYKLSALEINLLYHIIGKLQGKMKKDYNDKFIEEQIILELKDIDKHKNYYKIKKALKRLRIKDIEVKYNLPNSGNIVELNTGIISGFKHQLNSKFITIYIPSAMSKCLCYIGGGFTSFQKVIAINLTSIYSKRMYEFCCRWVTKTPVYKSTIERYKEFLNVQGKYSKISHLKSKVLDIAEKELRNKADLFFTYSLQKTGKKYTHITFVIHTNIKINEKYKGVKADVYNRVYIQLRSYFPNHIDNSAQIYTDRISSLGLLEKINNRLQKLDDELLNGHKTKGDIKNLLQHRIFPEYNIAKKPPLKKMVADNNSM